MTTIKVSVRNLVEFVLRYGDLQPGSIGASRAQEGIRAHQHVQKLNGAEYVPEVTLSYVYPNQEAQRPSGISETLCLEIKGRADGIIMKESGACIDEIKTTSLDLDLIDESFNELHWAQAQCYAFMYAVQEGITTVEAQLTYFQLDTAQIKKFTRKFSWPELSKFFVNLVERYLTWASRLQEWELRRDASIRRTQFPFGTYRPGQRELAVAVYQTIKESQKLFAQAPTGIGKTMGTLYPALKAMAEGFTVQIFYLTAKTITRTVAEKALMNLQAQRLEIKRLTLTAKRKLCFLPEATCLPEDCLFARGYYDRVRAAVEDVFGEEAWTRQVIEEYARKHSICPFEFSLEMANWADVVICDYNYVFDPRVYLRRFFLEGGEYTFLVDEAHNLVDRARDMFSAELGKESWLGLKRLTKVDDPRLTKSLTKVNSALVKEKKRCTEVEGSGELVEKEPPTKLIQALRNFVKEAEYFLKTNEQPFAWREQLIEHYFQALSFIRTADSYDEKYVTFLQPSRDDLRVKLFCLDPSVRLKEALGRGRAAVIFSATLSPMEYFMNVLGGEETSYKLKLASPFSPENLCLLIHNRISTKYKQRGTSYDLVAEAIASAVIHREGNYLVYFPSYSYLHEVYLRFREQNTEVSVICQTPGMEEGEREEFLANFATNPKQTLVGFALMGGIFGEGIDLIGDRLSGAVIVGVGLPQISIEREIIRSYHETASRQGFEFAYVYPGLNKVLQAVGRVIRTEKDRGIVLLIDERFAQSSYKKLFPEEWKKMSYVANADGIRKTIRGFWAET
ncbi:ATP-dependent DNA helicase [Desulfosporosinus sp. Sb-LF]|uniref:ATP-dependent DNA helicase n=1 Tax=Desulfosporosinus sp. Sb-LF TaxID=2560027 RepID=UPI00107F5098|nr:ATP-dependent DNA helicase [Desulfosporosinus sp. Sb-LF]TGE33567.1 ATP-dependent DNA helicase [Desulfosporosinus sp. Sb-LF]